MTAGRMRPVWLGREPGQRLFGMFHEPAGPAVGAVLICAPLLFEQQRSHRLFAQLSEALTGHGLAVLRFDYLGCGDSEGGDDAFSLAQAQVDAERAACSLRERCPGLALIVLGVRAGALIAAPVAGRLAASALWLWQPVVDGAVYLDGLLRLDARERHSTLRYLEPPDVTAAAVDRLVGFACAASLRAELAAARLRTPSAPPWVCLLHAAGDDNEAVPARERIELPDELSAWVDQLDMGGRIAPALFRPLAAQLSALARPTGRERHG